ncbi:TetR family transcriptional regulator [Nocardia sp. ET3-3]|uniref:TetR family transcriptional regulator n=1 Tax=Nocardia terrae TaxID=2675851 RepID=A0A7K1URK8_9NOCA|nr:TetR family transcriptional regulator C-terminal domain-containing protein [Nocardia terrae]MVU76980.1 TetR family transcriptional regulator [Nocardia terrae]
MADRRPAETTDRRGQLLERLADAIAETGIEGVSIRDLAARAGVSIGTVQYHFPTKTELLLAAWHHVRAQAAERFLRSGVAEFPPRDQLLSLTELLLPPTPDDRLTRVWLALVARAAHDQQIAALHREQWRETEDLLTRVLTRSAPAREAESRDAATELLAMLDGLAIAVVTEPDRVSPEHARRLARNRVRQWLD